MSFSQTKKDNDNSLVLISSLIQDLENLIRLNLDEKSEILNLTSKISTEITQTAAKIKLEPSKFVKLRLQKDFSTLVQRFEKVSKDAASKKKQNTLYSFNTLGKSADLSDFDQGENEKTPLLQGQEQVVKLDREIEFNEALIQEREQDLESIEKSVAQVNEIFRDLGTLVHEQQ